MVIIYPPTPFGFSLTFMRKTSQTLIPTCIFSKLYGDHSHPDHITFFAEQDIMYYFLISHKIYTLFPAFCSWLPIKGTLLLDIEFWSQWVACFVLPGKTQPFSNVLYICRGFQEGGGLVIGEPRQGKGNFTPLWKGIHKVEYTIEIKKDFKN